jgi:hypothetical protein
MIRNKNLVALLAFAHSPKPKRENKEESIHDKI